MTTRQENPFVGENHFFQVSDGRDESPLPHSTPGSGLAPGARRRIYNPAPCGDGRPLLWCVETAPMWMHRPEAEQCPKPCLSSEDSAKEDGAARIHPSSPASPHARPRQGLVYPMSGNKVSYRFD